MSAQYEDKYEIMTLIQLMRSDMSNTVIPTLSQSLYINGWHDLSSVWYLFILWTLWYVEFMYTFFLFLKKPQNK